MQLRCAQTSELIAEGTPLEIATVAQDFADGDVLFDGVGGTFDPAAVRKFRNDEIAGLQAALARGDAGEDAEALRATLKERRDRIAAGKAKVASARQAMQDARERVNKRA